jgi:aryl-alcohol dehydrogenase-like predicted oxidoreductase
LARLGSSGLEVSELSLGSWRTYERISRDMGVAVMRKAREVGINFLDDARYNDESGDCADQNGLLGGFVGELFRASGWKRDGVTLANKLWWESWPEQSAEAELDAFTPTHGHGLLLLSLTQKDLHKAWRWNRSFTTLLG